MWNIYYGGLSREQTGIGKYVGGYLMTRASVGAKVVVVVVTLVGVTGFGSVVVMGKRVRMCVCVRAGGG